jgi:hypothetical protein
MSTATAQAAQENALALVQFKDGGLSKDSKKLAESTALALPAPQDSMRDEKSKQQLQVSLQQSAQKQVNARGYNELMDEYSLH